MKKSYRLACMVTVTLLGASSLAGCDSMTVNSTEISQVSSAGSYTANEHGITVLPAQGQAKAIRLQVVDNDIIRVTALPHDSFSTLPESLMVVAQSSAEYEVRKTNRSVIVNTLSLSAEVSLDDGHITVKNSKGDVLLDGVNSGEFGPVTADPVGESKSSYAISQQWNKASEEGFYGLGQHQDGRINHAGDNVELSTHNLQISIPFVVSTRHYGILWDNASITRFGNSEPMSPIKASFTLYDESGQEGGLTASYYDGDTLLLKQRVDDLDYQFLANNNTREVPFPEELGDVTQPRVVWKGQIKPHKGGLHKFRMYSSGYASLKIGDKSLLDRWRMNWNPWFHNAEIELDNTHKVDFEVNWDSQGGYFRLLHNSPQSADDQFSLQLASETAKAIDYYVVVGNNTDEVIAGYRQLTGKAVMLPKWAYGFWQSRERYKSQEELLNALKTYRDKRIPIDNIVLDWSYWPEDAWGSHEFDKAHFPDPKAMVDTVHDLNANIMISVWPKFYSTTDNYKEFDQKGYMLNKNVNVEGNLDWIGKGYLNGFYDPYPQESQEIFWRQINEKLNVLGFDAWWLDASEPDIHSNLSYTKRKEIMSPLSVGTGAQYFNSYALPNAQGVYEGERETDPHKRSFILTRSGFGGIQRTGSAIWSGDTVPRWSNLKEQIAAGVGTGLSGMPNWTMDIGGFTPENHYRYNGDVVVGHYSEMAQQYQNEWQELNLRWFQFGAFVPLFRSHGQNPFREVFNIADEGSEVYTSLLDHIELRYRLMPYIYSQAGDMFHKDGTLMRGLVMDFPSDRQAQNIDDAYMFGPSILVNPVYQYQSRVRDVYLPGDGLWYDFYSGDVIEGGKTIQATAPLTRIPLFVRAGAIIPTGESIQYVYDKPNGAYTLNVYTGDDGEFDLYQDDGTSYDYEKGGYTYTPISYDDSEGKVTIGKREGHFDSMAAKRIYHIRFIDKGETLTNFDAKPDVTVTYTGEAMTIENPNP